MNERAKNLTIVILKVIAAVGLLSMALVAPNALQALKVFDTRKKKYINTKVLKMVNQGYLDFKTNPETGTRSLYLTEKGASLLRKHQLKVEKKKRWDGKWRLVMFDIWEKRRSVRLSLRMELADFGFIKLQKSVWITPFECEEFVELIRAQLRIGRGLIYCVVSSIEDYQLKELFGLD